MSDWAAKVLAGVPRYDPFWNRLVMITAKDGDYVEYDYALAALAKLGAGDGLVDRATAALEGVTDGPWAVEYKDGTIRLLMGNEVAMCDEKYYPWTPENDKDWHFIAFTRQWVPEAAARIAALTAQHNAAQENIATISNLQAKTAADLLAAEAEAAALRAKLARLEGALTDMLKAVLRTTVCQGPVWPEDRPGVWLAALEACAKSVQEAVDAALTDGGSDDKPTVEQIIHLYGVDALCKALVPVILQEADVNKTPKCERDLSNVLTESAADARAEAERDALRAERDAADRIEALVNEAVLNKAAYESVSSLLLSVQQDCIKERQRAERLEAALRHYRETLCEGFCGEDMWADEGHSHPEIQRDCGGCLAASVLLSAALTDGGKDG